MRAMFTLFLLAAFALGPLPPVAAQFTSWIGGTGDWVNGANWTLGVPTATSEASIENGTATLGNSNATAKAIYIGSLGSGASLMLNNGSNLSVSNAIYVGLGGNGNFSMNGGALNVNGTGSSAGMIVGYSFPGSVVVTGGQCNINSELHIGYTNGTFTVSGSGQVNSTTTILGNSAGGTGNLRLNGGLFTTGQISKGNGSASVSFDGGTLRLSGNQSALFSSIGTVTLNTGGGTIDTQAFTVATATAFTGAGGLTKSGDGTLLLTGANTFSGGTTVNGGVLAVDGNQSWNRLRANSTVTINTGGTFELRGSNPLPVNADALDVVVNTGGTLRIVSGQSTATSVTDNSHHHLHNLTLGNSASVVLDANATGNIFLNQAFFLRGTITATGQSSITPIGVAASQNRGTGIGLVDNRTINVVNAGDQLTINANLVDGAAGSGLSKAGAGTLVLTGTNTFSGNPLVLGGTLAVDGNQNADRLRANARVQVNFGGEFAIRGLNALPIGASAVDVDLNGGTLRTSGGGSSAVGATGQSGAHLRHLNLFNGTVLLDYTGTGSAYGNTGFLLDGNISATGNSEIRPVGLAAALGVANAIALVGNRTISVIYSSPVLQNDTLTIRANLVNDAGSPAGALTINNSGTLFLNGANTFTGGTTLSAGTLRGTGSLASGISVAAGARLHAGDGSSGNFTLNGGLTLASGAVLGTTISSSTTATQLLKTGGLSPTGLDGMNLFVDLNSTPLTAGQHYDFTIAQGMGDQSLLSITDPSRFTFANVGNSNIASPTLIGFANGNLVLGFNVAPVPEPALLGVALLAVAAWRGRPRS